jgi:hypothetical protein
LWKFERCASPEKLKTGSTDRTNGLLESSPSLLSSDLSCVARAGLHNQLALLLLC